MGLSDQRDPLPGLFVLGSVVVLVATVIRDSTWLILTHKVDPAYPLEAMRQKLQGRVVVHLAISTAGDVGIGGASLR